MRPLCFVLMPFGTKPDALGRMVQFDEVYARIIAPAVADAELEGIRADEEKVGGLVHKAMYERLILCDYAVADLTTANANVYYELGVRHALRPWSTVQIAADTDRLPFDLAPDRALPYSLDAAGLPEAPEMARAALAGRLRAARDAATDSPVFQLVEGLSVPQLTRERADVFRDQVRTAQDLKERLQVARTAGADAVRAVEAGLASVADTESGVVVELLLAYRDVDEHQAMVDLVGRMAAPLASTVLVQEQLGFALNRLGRREEAERVLDGVIAARGASSETLGLLGRVRKDRWQDAVKAGRGILAKGLLDDAIDAYLRGFEADWRDAYPGVNALTLMEVRDPPDERRHELAPVVRYAVRRRISAGTSGYWDHATDLELAVLASDEQGAIDALGRALAALPAKWEAKTTADNLARIREARERRDAQPPWATEVEQELLRA